LNGFSFEISDRMKNHEIEIKLNLSNETNYRKIVNILSPDSAPIKQINYFFDSDQKSLPDTGWALRIRKEADKSFITLKGPKKATGENLAVREEYEGKIDTKTTEKYINEGMEVAELPDLIAGKIREACSGHRLNKTISFVNYRYIIKKNIENEAVEMAIDRTEFPDGSVDFEFEAELSDKSKYKSVMKVVEAIFNRAGVPILFQEKSKLARALQKGGQYLPGAE
jgi:uncharacterized protein YjbK